MGSIDPHHASRVHGLARIAKDIVEALVRDLKLRAGEFVYEKALGIAFKTRGLTVEEIESGLKHAVEQGWLAFDSAQRIYTLTHAGFAIV